MSAATVVAPTTLDEAESVLRGAAADRCRVTFRGGGTHGPHAEASLAITTTNLDRILDYSPGDQTVTVEAGMSLTTLASHLARHQQRFALDVALPERATIGGAIAANAFGPRRHRYGSLKDLILGVSFIRADGARARAGGAVVKNVAGFDIAKLLVGSYGTLAFIASATLRVHPLPERSRGLSVSALAPSDVVEFVAALQAAQLEPAAIIATRTDRHVYSVSVIFEGFTSGVRSALERASALANERSWSASEIDVSEIEGHDAQIRSGGPLRVRVTGAAADFAVIESHILTSLTEALDDVETIAYPSLGIYVITGQPREAATLRPHVERARTAIEARGGTLVLEALPADYASNPSLELDRWGTPPPSFRLMQALKLRFDPDRCFNPGIFVGGL